MAKPLQLKNILLAFRVMHVSSPVRFCASDVLVLTTTPQLVTTSEAAKPCVPDSPEGTRPVGPVLNFSGRTRYVNVARRTSTTSGTMTFASFLVLNTSLAVPVHKTIYKLT